MDIPRSCIFSPFASTRFAPFTERTPCLPKYVSALLPDGSLVEVLSVLELSGALAPLSGSELLSGTLSDELSGTVLSGTLSGVLSVLLSVELSGVLTLLSVEVDVTDEVDDVEDDDEAEEVDEVELDDSPEFPELSEQPQSKTAASKADKTALPIFSFFIISCPFLKIFHNQYIIPHFFVKCNTF